LKGLFYAYFWEEALTQMCTNRILKVKRSILVAPLLLDILTTSVVVAQTPSSAISHFKAGIKENKKNDFDRAIEEFTLAIEISSHPVQDRAGKRVRSQHLAAEAELDSTEETMTITVFDKFTALAYSNRCFARCHKGDFAGAIADCDQAVRITPRLAEGYLNRAMARTMVGDRTAALTDLNKSHRNRCQPDSSFCRARKRTHRSGRHRWSAF
jgi:tetratricopeptide (TPR) repeat protein